MNRSSVQEALATAVRTVSAFPSRGVAPRPLGFPGLALSVVAIATGAIALACLAAVSGVLILYAVIGSAGVADFMTDMRFELPLKVKMSSACVGAVYAGVAIATLAAAALVGGGGWRDLVAVRAPRPRRDAWWVAAATLGYAILATMISISGQTRLIGSGPTDVILVAIIATNLVVLAPIAEELFFRGWLYTALRARLGFWPSYLGTATLFAAVHWDPNHRQMLRVLPLALALGLLRETTGSIKPTIALHAAYNGAIVALTLLLS